MMRAFSGMRGSMEVRETLRQPAPWPVITGIAVHTPFPHVNIGDTSRFIAVQALCCHDANGCWHDVVAFEDVENLGSTHRPRCTFRM
jgi:hypothetical protein